MKRLSGQEWAIVCTGFLTLMFMCFTLLLTNDELEKHEIVIESSEEIDRVVSNAEFEKREEQKSQFTVNHQKVELEEDGEN
ncbi:hypothetical protein [Alkalihalobacillus pseudalcaliphilus]|uniref:hypothetical protein n=1 Tax=Alkalihalobacillus pseudalcaliphilus TaxID=79884 RepID=UPI00064DE644|nr:hypothetical protein [Alkalihalobacillus pseudalcaliphilus]KMK76594.1 hypothetical protein AB990_15630 [Alkalihalobacillus pseudalcaliphilus]